MNRPDYQGDPAADLQELVDKMFQEAYLRHWNAEVERLLFAEGTGQPLGLLTSLDGIVAVRRPDPGPWTCRHGVWAQFGAAPQE